MARRVMSERTITNQIVKWLKAQGFEFVIKTHGAAFQMAGLPDIITIAANGRFVGLEVKRPDNGTLTPLQVRILKLINRCGGYAVVVRSVPDVQEAMIRAYKGERG